MSSTTLVALAAEHVRDLRTAAAHDRLGALARCCRPTTWRRALARLLDRSEEKHQS